MSLLEDLKKAYEFHLANEWIKSANRLSIDDGKYAYCLNGAVMYSLGRPCDSCTKSQDDSHFVHTPASIAVYDLLYETVNDVKPQAYDPIDFNDVIAKSKEDVTAVFVEAIRRLEQEESSRDSA